MKISVIITGYNAEEYAKQCVESVLNQSYKNFEILLYNDASTDKTKNILEPYVDSKNVWLYNSPNNIGALYGRYTLTRLATGDIVCFLGMDDYLMPDALKTIARAYEDGAKMTYGSWMTPDRIGMLARPYPDEAFELKDFRRRKWEATALNTFSKDLLLSVKKSKLQRNGEWLTNCTDLAYSFPCLEQCTKDEVKVIKEFIYVYRYDDKNSTLNRLGKEHKNEVREWLKTIQ